MVVTYSKLYANDVDFKERHPELQTPEELRQELDRHIDEQIEQVYDDYKHLVDELTGEHQYLYEFSSSWRGDTAVLSRNQQFMKKALKRYIHRQELKTKAMYKHCLERMPISFHSNLAAERHLERCKTEYLAREALVTGKTQNRKWLTISEAVEVFIESRLGATVMSFEGYSASTLIVYDYDLKLYTFDQDTIGRWLTVLVGSASTQHLKTFITTLQGIPDKLAIYNPVPRWKIPVGNGIYNTVTRTLEPYTPRVMVTSRIQTNFNPNAKQPIFSNGITFEKLISDLANHNPDRIALITQVCKSIILGYSSTPAIFIFIGSGGDGKSIFMSLLANVIGAQNCGALNFSDMGDESKVVESAQKKLVLGMDNNQDVRIKNTALLKSAASREVISLFRKYLTSVSLRFTGSIVQLCNSMPKIAETGASMRRRLLAIACENSHYEKGDEINSLQELIKDNNWHEYILATLLHEQKTPYYTDFNDVDRNVINTSLDSDDPIGSFFKELEATGVLDESTTVLPRSMLYAAYIDWMRINYPGANIHSSRSFGTRTNELLREHGFESVDGGKPSRLLTISRTYHTDFATLFGQLSEGESVKDTIEQNASTRILARTRRSIIQARDRRNGRRHSEICDVATYFNIWADVISDVQFCPRGYQDIILECDYVFTDVARDTAVPDETLYGVILSGETDEELDSYYEQSYQRFMAANGYLSEEELDNVVDLNSGPSFGERILQELGIEAYTGRPITGEPTPDIDDNDTVDHDYYHYDTYDLMSTPYDDILNMPSDCILQNISSITDINTLPYDIIYKILSISTDLVAALRKQHKERVTQLISWLKQCAKVDISKDIRLPHVLASIVDVLSTQVTKYATSDQAVHTVTSIHLSSEDSLETRMEYLISTLQSYEKSMV